MGCCKRDTTGIMIASNETIVICNVQPYGWGVGDGEGMGESVMLFKKSSVFCVVKLIYCKK